MRITGLACALLGVLALTTGCGFKVAGPGETISVAPLATEDLSGSCDFDMNMPDQPLAVPGQASTTPVPTEVAALVVYERGDSETLFNDPKVQSMAAALHLVTVFAHQCNAKSYDDIQVDASKGQARMLFAALTQYAVDNTHPEIANTKVILSGFSAAGVLTVTMEADYPDRVLTALPYAAGCPYLDLDNIAVSAAMAHVPTLVLSNAYDSQSGDQRSLRYFQRGAQQGAVWAFGAQNHTGHCCTLSTRDVMIPWVTALTPAEPPLVAANTTPSPVAYQSFAVPSSPNVSFWTYTDGWPDAQGEVDFWIPTAAVSPTAGGPNQAWMPNAAAAQAWLTWVLSPGTN